MQAEDIIQQKEWSHLTDAERELLAPLAADEQEFNLLKKMLLVAEEEASDVPAINPAIQQRLQHSVQGKRSTGYKKWYYAAAAVLLIAATGWYFLQYKKEKPEALVKTPVQQNKKNEPVPGKNEIQKPVDTIQQNIATTEKRKDTATPIINPPPVYVQIPPPLPPIKQVIVDTVTKPPLQYASINAMVKNDSSLMAFVTETY